MICKLNAKFLDFLPGDSPEKVVKTAIRVMEGAIF